MKRFFLRMELRDLPGSAERVLGVVRFRGFHLLEMSAHVISNSQNMELTLRVEGSRSGDGLLRQLQKLADMREIEMFVMPVASNNLVAAASA